MAGDGRLPIPRSTTRSCRFQHEEHEAQEVYAKGKRETHATGSNMVPEHRGLIRTIMSAAAGHPCACPIWGGRAGLLGRRHKRDPRAVSRTCHNQPRTPQSQTTGTQTAAHAHSRALFNRRITCRQHPLNNPLSVWPKLTESRVHQPTLP